MKYGGTIFESYMKSCFMLMLCFCDEYFGSYSTYPLYSLIHLQVSINGQGSKFIATITVLQSHLEIRYVLG